MKNKNLIVLSVLAVILLSSTFVSMAQAQERETPSEPPVASDTVTDENSTSTDNDAPLISPYDNQTDLIAPAPDDTSSEEHPNVIGTQTTDNTLLIGVAAAVIVAVVGIGAFLFFRFRARTCTQ
jgi:hypothetical protein